MRVYRIEDECNRGPFMTDVITRRHSAYHRMPGPYFDLDSDLWRDWDDDALFAMPDHATLMQFWPHYLRKKMHEEGFRVCVYSVEDDFVVTSKSGLQVAFCRYSAVKVSEYSLIRNRKS